ncbi:YIP1 family protein [Roseobacter weihaiensis]|uniref:YIP1 family protein n=1 Tax=Roseobacter weihaiensis TaxID=2763262 RepID=UPI001D0A0827|nr:YIP1 family protein [Roseobacter sp. H9]
MTQTTTFPELALLTLRDPRAAAEIILGWNISREALWTAIALVSVIVTILSTLSNLAFPVPAPLNAVVGNPLMYFIVAAGGFVATVYAVYWTGMMLGGRGTVEDLMLLILWLQALRAAAQVAVLLTLLVAPVLASFLVLFVAVATLWIFVQFISIGLHLESILRALVVLVISAVALVAGLSFLLSLIGFTPVGGPPNV